MTKRGWQCWLDCSFPLDRKMALFDSHSYYSFFLSSSTTNGGVAILHLLLHFFFTFDSSWCVPFIHRWFFFLHMYVDMQGSMCLHGQRHIAVILLNISFKDFWAGTKNSFEPEKYHEKRKFMSVELEGTFVDYSGHYIPKKRL